MTGGTLSQVTSNQPLFLTAPPVGEVIYEESASNKRIEALAECRYQENRGEGVHDLSHMQIEQIVRVIDDAEADRHVPAAKTSSKAELHAREG